MCTIARLLTVCNSGHALSFVPHLRPPRILFRNHSVGEGVNCKSEAGMTELRLLDVGRESDGPDWVIRIVIAILLGIAGSEKFSNAPYSSWVRMFNQIGWGDWFRYFTGVV